MRWAEMVAALYADVVIVGDLERVQRKLDGQAGRDYLWGSHVEPG